jgi:hypothetical protein
MANFVLEKFDPIAVGDEQDYDIDFTPYVTGLGEAVGDAHTLDLITAATGITLQSSAIHNGATLKGVASCFVKVWLVGTQKGTFEVVVRVLTAAGRKHTGAITVKVAET